jgi:hypothetical protein
MMKASPHTPEKTIQIGKEQSATSLYRSAVKLSIAELLEMGTFAPLCLSSAIKTTQQGLKYTIRTVVSEV